MLSKSAKLARFTYDAFDSVWTNILYNSSLALYEITTQKCLKSIFLMERTIAKDTFWSEMVEAGSLNKLFEVYIL